jgi:hypothetical protein
VRFDPCVLFFGGDEEPLLAGAPAKTPIDAPEYMRIRASQANSFDIDIGVYILPGRPLLSSSNEQ